MTRDLRITVDLPVALSAHPTDELAARARLLLVLDEVHAGRLSRAGAARALGISLDDFLVAAGERGLFSIDHDPDDFRRELDANSAP